MECQVVRNYFLIIVRKPGVTHFPFPFLMPALKIDWKYTDILYRTEQEGLVVCLILTEERKKRNITGKVMESLTKCCPMIIYKF